jgi:hypothetical protein
MELPLIVALLTCDRLDYTSRTLSSFFKFNKSDQWLKFYADDASTDQEGTKKLVESFGFQPLVQHTKRRGIGKTNSDLIEQLGARMKQGTVLILQNDFECVRPLPLDVIELLFKNPRIGWVRMGGRWKDFGKTPVSQNWLPHCFPPTKWESSVYGNEEVEIGRSYFCHCPPPLIPIKTAISLIVNTKNEFESGERSSKLNCLVARFMKNILCHIGIKGTTGTIK